MDEERCCGTCRYHWRDSNSPEDWGCGNEMSQYYSDYTGYDDGCDDWEERERNWV